MAEVKSRKKSGTLRRESEVKGGRKKLPSRNDYQVNPFRWNIILARGRDINSDEKIVWTASNKEMQNRRIKSRRDNTSIAYQRGAAAIARQVLKDTGGKMRYSTEQAQAAIDNYYSTYPEVREYVQYCKDRVLEPGWIETPYGRRRRFVQQGENSFIAAQQRECVNFVIQSTVADTLNTALVNFWWWRRLHPGKAEYRLLLPVHDAVMLECSPSSLETVLDKVIPECMVDGAVVPAWRPQGLSPRRSFKLETDVKFGLRWGEHAGPEELIQIGVPSHIAERNK